MPSYGTLDHERLLPRVPRVEDLAVERHEIRAAETLLFAFEVAHEAALESIPKALGLALPAHAVVEIRRHLDSPWGTFMLARLMIAVRASSAAAGYAIGGFCDNDAAIDYLRLHYGARLKRAAISLERRYFGIEGRIAAESKLVFDALLERPEADALDAREMAPALHLAKFEGQLWLVEERTSHVFEAAERGPGLIRRCDGEAFGEPRLSAHAPMPAFYARSAAAMEPVAALIDPALPAYLGTRKVAGTAAA